MFLLFFIICFCLFLFLIRSSCNKIKYQIILPSIESLDHKTFLIVGSIHGNELSGSVACQRFIKFCQKNQRYNKHKWIVIYQANPCGIKMGWRQNPYTLFSKMSLQKSDMNRQYDHGGTTPINQQILYLIQKNNVDFIIDLHEAWGLPAFDPQSMGNGIFPNSQTSWNISKQLLESRLNQTIDRKDYYYQVKRWPLPDGSLRQYSVENDINYILIETSTEQSFSTRIKQHYLVLQTLFYIK